MIRHIVAWNYKESLSEQERRETGEKIKCALERLKTIIPGIIDIKVFTEMQPTGNRDLMLDSSFESAEALAAYQIHPEHVKASAMVGEAVQNRACMDFVA